MKTLKTILDIAGISFLGCSFLCVVVNIIQDINMPTTGFGYAGLSMLICFLLIEVSELRSNEEVNDVFKKCIRSDIAAINAKISDLLMPGGAKEARHEMLKQWILAHFIEAAGKCRVDFAETFTANFSYKYGGKWAMSTVKIQHPGHTDFDLFESVFGPYAGMLASIVMEGRDWDLFDFNDASAFFEKYNDPFDGFVSVSPRNA